ncbi:hypothetical protein AAEJ74_28225, partial [Limnospira fusiformis PMC 851.14]
KRSICVGIPSLDLSCPPGYFKGLCTTKRCFWVACLNSYFSPYSLSAACQPVSLPNSYDGSSQTFGFPNHGWLAVVE